MITLIQIVAIIFALFAFSRVVLRLREKKLSILEFLFWTVIWLGLVLIAVIPEAVNHVAILIGLQSGTGLILYIGMILAFYLIFRLYVKLDELSQGLTALSRTIALFAKQSPAHRASRTKQRKQ
jgi:small membrane protein